MIARSIAAMATLAACTPTPPPPPAPVEPIVLAAAPDDDAAAPVAERDALADYVLDAELSIVPLSRQTRAGEPEDVARARYAAIAHDVAEVSRVSGATAFPREPADVASAHLAVVLVAIASHETGMLRALDGDSMPCPAHLGGCDGGNAHGIAQVHAERGHDRAYYLRIGANIAARSVAATGGLSWYSGESADAPKARMMMQIASRYWASHPYAAGAP